MINIKEKISHETTEGLKLGKVLLVGLFVCVLLAGYNNPPEIQQKGIIMKEKPTTSQPEKPTSINSTLEVKAAELELKEDLELKDKFKDRVWVTDSNKVQLIELVEKYKNKYFPTSPAQSEMIVSLAQQEEFPLDFLLVAGHYESHFCTRGRGAQSNNCMNINNTDPGDGKATVCGQYTQCLSDVQTGLRKFSNLIKNCYIGQNQHLSLQTFLDNDFRIQRTVPPHCTARVGARYMTDKNSQKKYQDLIQNNLNPIFNGYNKTK
jgi:hypothetical protein